MSLSRRDFMIMAAAGTGTVAACACTGLGIAAYLITGKREPETVVLPASTEAAVLPIATVPPLRIITKAEWDGLEANHEAQFERGFYTETNLEGWRVYTEPLADVYNTVVIHHSVAYAYDDVSSMKDIQRLHQQERKWADIGYHYLIGKEGGVYEGRPIDVRGIHVGGYNTGTIGICLLGNFMETVPSTIQLENTYAMVRWVAQAFQLTHLGWHRQFVSNTVCPGDNLVVYLPDLAANAGLATGTEGYIPLTATPNPEGTSFSCNCQHDSPRATLLT